MKCPKCGANLHESDLFCGDCGKKVTFDTSNEKRLVSKFKWYSIGNMIVPVLFIFSLLLNRMNMNSLSIFLIIISIGWVITGLVILVYSLAKRYEPIFMSIPLIYLVQLILSLILLNSAVAGTFFFIEYVIFSLLVIGLSLYTIYKKD